MRSDHAQHCRGRLSRRALLHAWPALPLACVPARAHGAPARAIIFFNLYGGPSHLDTWDPKPEAPPEVRGEFGFLRSSLGGIRVTDQLPLLARSLHHFSLLRALNHNSQAHNSANYLSLSGFTSPLPDIDIPPSRDHHPIYSSVIGKLRPARPDLPPSVSMISRGQYERVAGNGPGLLGQEHQPFTLFEDPSQTGFRVGDLTPPGALIPARLERRGRLVDQLDRHLSGLDAGAGDLSPLRQRALGWVTSAPLKRALALGTETERVRTRYGMHREGQALLLARRLVEAGVPAVTVNWGAEGGEWDTHTDNFVGHRKMLPKLDQCLTALVEDLHDRGMLESTLLVVSSEFGRTPKVNHAAGRDHWPSCYTALLAGGGVRRGVIHGESDPHGAYPKEGACAPEDLIATIFHCLQVPMNGLFTDPLGKTVPVCTGRPIRAILG